MGARRTVRTESIDELREVEVAEGSAEDTRAGRTVRSDAMLDVELVELDTDAVVVGTSTCPIGSGWLIS